jgi:hypothetical protein
MSVILERTKISNAVPSSGESLANQVGELLCFRSKSAPRTAPSLTARHGRGAMKRIETVEFEHRAGRLLFLRPRLDPFDFFPQHLQPQPLPRLPSSAAADFAESADSSSSSPVAIRMTLTALPITSAGRFSPPGPRGIESIPSSNNDFPGRHTSGDPGLKIVDDNVRRPSRPGSSMAVQAHFSPPFTVRLRKNGADRLIPTFKIYAPFTVLLFEPKPMHSVSSLAFRLAYGSG